MDSPVSYASPIKWGKVALNAAPSLVGFIGGELTKNNYKKDPLYKEYSSLYNTLNSEIKKPYLETTQAKSILATIRENNKRRMKRITAAKAVNGLTDEATVAAMGNANEAEANAVSNIAGNADHHRNNLLNQRFNTLSGMMNVKERYRQRNARNISNIVGPLSSATQGLSMSDAYN